MRMRHRRIFLAAASALATMGLMASVAQATPPPAPYQDFAGCPSPAESPFVAFCFKYQFTGGHLQLGKKNIPITSPIVFRGGERYVTGQYLSNSEAGIVPTRQIVEGGLIGITGNKKLDEAVAAQSPLKVYATIELAGTPGSLTEGPLSLPIKVHLENPVLGNACYIGSTAAPIQLNLITGTTNPPAPNNPITGVEGGGFESEAARPEVLVQNGGQLVDNSFAAPAANGCQLNVGSYHLNIDKYVNQAAALPSAAGKNEARLNFGLSLVSPETAYEGV